MKKITIKLLSVLILIVSVFIFVGCKDDEIRLEPEAPKVITLDKNNVELVLCESIILNAVYGEVPGASLTFSSSNSSVATVTQDGLVKAENTGTATITASYNGNTASCVVSVVTNGILPTVEPIANISDTVIIGSSGSIDFEASVLFNGVRQTGGTISYSVADTTVGTLEGSVFTPVSVGETTVTITGEWKGISSAMLTKTFNVKVINDIEILINNGLTSELHLYVVGEHAGNTYATSSPFLVSAQENGVAHSTNVTVIEGEGDIISYDADTQVVTALNYGSAKIQIAFTDSNNVGINKIVDVIVDRPVATYENPIEFFSAEEGDLPLTEIFGKEVELVEVYEGDNKLQVEDNKVLGIASLRNKMSQKTIRVYSADNVGYDLTLEVYTRVINTAQELANVLALSTNKTIDGYYVLGNDIHDYTVNVANPSSAGSFCGVFDGLGHSLSLKITGPNGIFGRFGLNAVVKNVAFTDIILEAKSETTNVSLLAMRVTGATRYIPIIFDNIYISIKDFNTKYDGAYASVLLESNWAYIRATNMIIDVTAPVETELTTSFGYGALFVRDGYTAKEDPNDYTTTYYNNVFVLTESFMPMTKYVEKSKEITAANNLLPWNYVRLAGNDLPIEDRILGKEIEGLYYGAQLAYDNVKRYDTLADMKADQSNSYLTFDSMYWDLSSGVPVWRTLKTNVAKVTVDGVEDRYLDLYTIANETIGAKSKATVGLNANGLEVSDVAYAVTSGTGTIEFNAETKEITALQKGTAVVTVSFTYNGETYEKELNIRVIDVCDLITTSVNGEIADKAQIYSVANEGLGLANEATLSLNDAGYTLENITYSVSEGEDIASVDANGKVTALKTGNATVTIAYAINGITYETSVEVEVIGSDNYVYVTINGADMSSDTTAVELGTTGTLGINANGFTIENVSYALTAGESCVDFDPATQLITPKASGIATITITFTLGGHECSKEVYVAVVPKAEVYQGDAIMFSAEDHGASDNVAETLFGAGAEIIVALDMNGNNVKVENGLIVGLEANTDGTVKNVQLQVFTADKGYIANFKVYTKVIRTEDDFLKYANGLDGKTKPAMTRTGTYILANDIGTEEKPVYTNRSTYKKYVFAGTLDGNGHTVYVKLGWYGIFDTITSTTVVKNISVVVKGYRTVNKSLAYNTVFAYMIEDEGYTFENVYVKVATDVTALGYPILIAQARPEVGKTTSKLKNIIIEIEDEKEYAPNTSYLGFLYKYDETYQNGSDLFENVNLITTYKWVNTIGDGRIWYAQNDSELKAEIDALMKDNDPDNDPLVAGTHLVAGKKYVSYQYGYSGQETTARTIFRYDDLATMYQDTSAQQVGNWKVVETTEGDVTSYSIVWNVEA